MILPVVDVHLYTGGVGAWSFNYTITFQFDDGSFSYSPAEAGIPSILLDNNTPDHSGICREADPWPVAPKPASEPVYLASVTLDFGTHTDDKAADTRLNVHIVNRLSATSSQDIVVAEGLFDDQGFPQPTSRGPFTHLKDFPGDRTVVFGQGSILPLASEQIQLQDLVLPVVYITVAPTGGDRWIFDYRVTYAFSNGMRFSSTTSNVNLNRESNTHQGVYNGPPLPTYAPPPPTSVFWTPTVATRDKKISLSFVQAKLDELVNDRPDPLFRFRLDNVGNFGLGVRESYYDLQSITAAPPPPGTRSGPGYIEPVAYRSGPTSLGFLDNDASFDKVEGDWYFRTHAGDLYLTADPAMTITQQPRYPAPGSAAANPDAQRWKLTPGLQPAADFTISNAAYPTKVLQPQNGSAAAGARTVLGDPEPAGIATHIRNAWHVTSPLLPVVQQRPVAHV